MVRYIDLALTPEELCNRIPNWSLESDGQLLQYMVSIAKNVEDLCTKTRENLDSLMLNVKHSELALANATNQFSAVEQVKFVENRVEEDDESFYGLRRRRQQVDEPRKEAEQEQVDERTLDDLIQVAVERSTERMYESYDKFLLPLSDTESSDGDYPPPARRTLMQALPAPYDTDRRLPFVIGTQKWQDSWHVGLNEGYECNSDRKEEYSDSPSETDDGGMFPSQPNSKQHTPSESESSIWGTEGRKRAPSLDPSITGDDGSSIYSFASSSKVPRTLPTKQVVVGRPENSRLKPPSLFPEESPPEDGRPSKSERGLFDDSPEVDESMPTPTPQPRQTVPVNDTTKAFFKGNTQPAARKLVNLFDDEPPEPLQDPSVLPERKKTINLFIESDDDEEEVRENVRNNNRAPTIDQKQPIMKQVSKNRGSALTNPKPMPELIDELNNNLRKQHEPSAGSELSRVVSTEGNRHRPTVNNQRPETNLFDDEPPVDTFDQLFNAAKPSIKPTVRPVDTPAPQVTTSGLRDKIIVNLFAEDDEDDYGGIVVGSNETKPQPKSPQQGTQNMSGRIMLPKPADRLPVGKKKSIFDESESEEDTEAVLFGGSGDVKPVATKPNATPKVIKSIFSDSSEAEDDDDEALFGKSSNILKNKLDALKRNVGTAGAHTEQIPPMKTENNLPSKSKSLFDEDSDSDQLVPNDQPLVGSLSKPAAVLEPVKTTKNAPRVSLFDDEPPSDDEDALFGKSTTSKAIPQSRLNRVEDKPNKAVVLDKPKSEESDTRNNEVPQQPASNDELFAGVQSHESVPKQSPESIKSQPPPKEAVVDPINIRSLILKKSIFSSDSESEEDDSIFDSVPKSAAIMKNTTTSPETNVMVGDKEISVAQEESSQMHDTPSNVVPSIEIKANVEDDTKTNDWQNEENPSQSIKNSVQEECNDEVQIESADPIPFEASTSKSGNELSRDGRTNSIEEKDELPQTEPCDEVQNSTATLVIAIPSNNVLVDTDRNEVFVDERAVNLEKNHIEPTEIEEKSHGGDESSTGMMIANDIDYYLHTNETTKDESSKPAIAGSVIEQPPPTAPLTPPSAKSEPKSALTFSPIGLFDDVPPPDDGDETDDATQHRQHPHNTVSGEPVLPSIMDDTASYPTESQSLNFIPNSGAGGNRSRYLFDDEPPPDEADNARTKSNFDDPSAGRMGSSVNKGLFDNVAPASLPPMVEDSNRVDSIKPGRLKINKLNTKITINVAALLPGARRSTGNASSSPEKVFNDVNNDATTADHKKSAQSGDVSTSEKLTSLNKGRARIPTKRKPPSRHNLRAGTGSSSVLDSPSAEEHIQNDVKKPTADDRIVVGSEGKIEHIEAGLPQTNFPPQNHLSSPPKVVQQSVQKRNNDPFVDRLSASVRNPTKRSVLPDGTEGAKTVPVVSVQKTTAKPSTKSIFDDSDSNDEDNDVFSSKLPSKAVPVKKPAPVQEAATKLQPTNVGSRSIFVSDDEDDTVANGEADLFGTKVSSIAGQLKSKGVDAVASRAGPKTERKGLFDDDDDGSDDDDDLFGSKSRTTSKVNTHQPQLDQTKAVSRSVPIITRPLTTTTQTGDDPLADLLADS
ncbi:WASH complex subunit 2 [Anopheles moucheti]|uniref:WASH complex subunit 2 n=1 Tax=Anopheles moucheti TaxID=186751 RepID=UPI0022F048C8|nr:WASH complex subunit 2 [Anopheles moucheti]